MKNYSLMFAICLILCISCGKKKTAEKTGDTINAQTQITELDKNAEKKPIIALEDTAAITDYAIVKTNLGKFRIALYGKDAPKNVENFINLIESNFYDNLLVHRIARGFLIQMGDPKTKEKSKRDEWGSGGKTYSGKALIDELNQTTPSFKKGYIKGVVAMSKIPGQKNSATSQFFICLDKAIELPREYTIIGKVVEGINIVEKIAGSDIDQGPLGANDGIPKKPIIINSIRMQKIK